MVFAPTRARRWPGDRRPGRLPFDWRHLDWIMLTAVLLIFALGLVMIYSSTRRLTEDPFYFVKRQGFTAVLGVALGTAVLSIDYRKFRDFSLAAYIGVIALLFLVLTPIGSASKGAQAWYQLPGGFQFQPSEIAKFGLIVALCGYVNEHRGDMDPWRITVIVGLALVPLGLVQLQPDLGTNLVLLFIVLGLLAVAGAKGRHLVALALLAATGVYAVVSLGVLKEYQVDRLTVVFDQSDEEGAAYNVTQSKNTISSGGFLGQGFLEGPQTRLNYVPEQHTDFIFTAVGEELGFVGAASLLGLFAIVMWRTWRTARLARDFYGTLVCAAVFSMFAFQIFENVGMTMGIMPVTGIPLPLMSYGGSSLLATAACVALVLNVNLRRFS